VALGLTLVRLAVVLPPLYAVPGLTCRSAVEGLAQLRRQRQRHDLIVSSRSASRKDGIGTSRALPRKRSRQLDQDHMEVVHSKIGQNTQELMHNIHVILDPPSSRIAPVPIAIIRTQARSRMTEVGPKLTEPAFFDTVSSRGRRTRRTRSAKLFPSNCANAVGLAQLRLCSTETGLGLVAIIEIDAELTRFAVVHVEVVSDPLFVTGLRLGVAQ
jgi:hypothetical protein